MFSDQSVYFQLPDVVHGSSRNCFWSSTHRLVLLSIAQHCSLVQQRCRTERVFSLVLKPQDQFPNQWHKQGTLQFLKNVIFLLQFRYSSNNFRNRNIWGSKTRLANKILALSQKVLTLENSLLHFKVKNYYVSPTLIKRFFT